MTRARRAIQAAFGAALFLACLPFTLLLNARLLSWIADALLPKNGSFLAFSAVIAFLSFVELYLIGRKWGLYGLGISAAISITAFLGISVFTFSERGKISAMRAVITPQSVCEVMEHPRLWSDKNVKVCGITEVTTTNLILRSETRCPTEMKIWINTDFGQYPSWLKTDQFVCISGRFEMNRIFGPKNEFNSQIYRVSSFVKNLSLSGPRCEEGEKTLAY